MMDTVKAQLVKPKPNEEIVEKSWDALKAVATVGGVIGCYKKKERLYFGFLNIL